MGVVTPDSGLEPGLPVDEIESRLIDAATRHHLEERNMAYWLLELDRRRLYEARGFSSIGDYSLELIGVKPRKAQYLVFIATRLEKLPAIREAFDSGALSWTKAREIVSVASPETEAEWLEKARVLSNRDLEKEVRRHDGRGSGAFATVTISMPVEVLEMWNDAYELAERLYGSALEKWQVLEPALAEFLTTHVPPEYGNGPSPAETPDRPDREEEDNLPASVRDRVLERDRWTCAFPGCTMRKTLEVHHIVFRSRGGGDEPENLVSLCTSHHVLVHRGICSISGRVGVNVTFERPRLVTERKPESVETSVPEDPTEGAVEEEASQTGDEESWCDEVAAEIFDGPPSQTTPERETHDPWAMWIEPQKAFELRARAKKRRERRAADLEAGAHVCVERVAADAPAGKAGDANAVEADAVRQ